MKKLHLKLRSKKLTLAIIAATLATVAGIRADAQTTIANYNFDSSNIGDAVPTTAPGTDTLPQQSVYSVGGYPNDNDPSTTNPLTGTATVQNVGGLSKAALLSTNQAGTGALYVDTQFLATAPKFDFSFDIDVITTPTTGLAQSGVGAPNGQAFAINAFGLDSSRLFRFAVSPTSDTGGNFGYRLPGSSGDLATFGTYTDGQTHHVDIQTDFNEGTLNISLDGTQVVTNAALLNPGSGYSELFLFQNGVEGVSNQVALDNIQVVATPEPSSWALGLIAAGGLFALRRRSQRA